MNNQLYYLIKDKPKFNKIRFDYFQCLTREIVDGNEFFCAAGGKIRMENSIEFKRLFVDYWKILSKISAKTNYNKLEINELCRSIVKEIFKENVFSVMGSSGKTELWWVKHSR